MIDAKLPNEFRITVNSLSLKTRESMKIYSQQWEHIVYSYSMLIWTLCEFVLIEMQKKYNRIITMSLVFHAIYFSSETIVHRNEK